MIACVYIRHFAAAIERQRHPELGDLPLVIYTRKGARQIVQAVSAEAQRAGVQSGMTLKRAQGHCPDAHLIPAVESRCRYAFDGLVETLRAFSDRIEPLYDPDGAICYLDLGRLKATDLRQIGADILKALDDRHHLAASIGLAAGKFPARAAALRAEAGSLALLALGQEARFLAPLPVTWLPLDRETARRLSLLGIRACGQLAALPSSAVPAQFGMKGRRLHRLAQGCDDRPVIPTSPRQTQHAAYAFEPPVTDRFVVEAVLNRLSAKLAARLEAEHLTSRDARLTLHLENRAVLEDGAHPHQAISGAGRLSRTLTGLLERLPVAAGIVEVEIWLAELVPLVPRQLSLFAHHAGEYRLQETLDDLVVRHGADCLYRPQPAEQGSYLLERRFRLESVTAA